MDLSMHTLKRAQYKAVDTFLENFWFLTPVAADRIGYGQGLLNQMRQHRHKKLRRDVHIALLNFSPTGPKFGPLTAFWINENCRRCSASVNERIEEADVIWTYSQDPIDHEEEDKLLACLERARPDVHVINHPHRYNAYYEPTVFQRLAAAGVNVPRSRFTQSDVGHIEVVYKLKAQQGGYKTKEVYSGDKPDFNAFEFIDSRDDEGLYRRYRSYYILGALRADELMRTEDWASCWKNKPKMSYTFEIPELEAKQLQLIAKTLDLQFFAVDYLRRRGDEQPFFTDINIYPHIVSFRDRARHTGNYGIWHNFELRERLQLPEPGGKSFAEVFDEAVWHFVRNEPYRHIPH